LTGGTIAATPVTPMTPSDTGHTVTPTSLAAPVPTTANATGIKYTQI